MRGGDTPLDDKTEALVHECIGGALAVHRTLGPVYPEQIYQRAMYLELSARRLTFDRERRYDVMYRGTIVGTQRVDLVVGNAVVLELKAVDDINAIHVAQLIAYLHGTDLHVGLIINFKVPLLKQGLRRIVR